MSLQKGAATFRIFSAEKQIGQEIHDCLRPMSYKKLDPSQAEGVIFDATRGVSLVGNGIPPDQLDFNYGGNLFFAIRRRESVTNPAILKEYFNYLIDKEIRETGIVPRGKVKKAIRETAIELAKDQKIMKINGTRVAIVPNSKFVVMDLSSLSKLDEIQVFLESILPDNKLRLLDPDALYTLLSQTPSTQYVSLDINKQSIASGIGTDFLTWLWAVSDDDKLPSNLKVSACGDLTFKCDEHVGKGPAITRMTKGTPEGNEPAAAFNDGKKVSGATFRICKGSETYEVFLDETLLFNKFKQIIQNEDDKGEDGDGESTKKSKKNPQDDFADRILAIRSISDTVVDLFKIFVSMQKDNQQLIDSWLKNKWGLNI